MYKTAVVMAIVIGTQIKTKPYFTLQAKHQAKHQLK